MKGNYTNVKNRVLECEQRPSNKFTSCLGFETKDNQWNSIDLVGPPPALTQQGPRGGGAGSGDEEAPPNLALAAGRHLPTWFRVPEKPGLVGRSQSWDVFGRQNVQGMWVDIYIAVSNPVQTFF